MTAARRQRKVAVLLTLSGCALLSACLKSTEPQPSLLQLNGSWNYTGVQTSPVHETITGMLTISRESGTSFQGRLDLVGVNSQTGQSRVLGGLVSGSESVTGTWVGASADGSMSSGTFRVERETR